MQDPYPKYSETQSSYDNARENYINQKFALISRLEQTRDNLIGMVERILQGLTDRRREYGSIIDNRTRVANLFLEHQNSLETVVRRLLQTYREANRQTRAKPEPKYWSSQFKLERRKAAPNTDDEATPERLEQADG